MNNELHNLQNSILRNTSSRKGCCGPTSGCCGGGD